MESAGVIGSFPDGSAPASTTLTTDEYSSAYSEDDPELALADAERPTPAIVPAPTVCRTVRRVRPPFASAFEFAPTSWFGADTAAAYAAASGHPPRDMEFHTLYAALRHAIVMFRIGRRQVIWWSILGVAPFTLALPHASLFWTGPLTFVIGLLLASAFPAILVYAQELFPGRVGMISGLFFGLAFGLAGIGAALLGQLADRTSIGFVYQVCAWLPLLGVCAVFLPDLRGREQEG